MVDRIRTNSIFRRVRGPPRGSPPVRLPCLFSWNLTRSSHDASRGHSIPPLPLPEGAGVGERGGARVEGTRFPDRIWEFDLMVERPNAGHFSNFFPASVSGAAPRPPFLHDGIWAGSSHDARPYYLPRRSRSARWRALETRNMPHQ